MIRHPLLDLWVLEEIFGRGAYVFPEGVLGRLRGLARPPRMLDLGGHVGLFALWFRDLFPDAWVTSFEPDPGNAAVLRRCVEANDLGSRWEVIEAAASTSDGTADFLSDFQLSHVGAEASALPMLHVQLEEIFPFLRGRRLMTPRELTVATRDVFPWVLACDFLKVDIQGGEWELLMDPRFAELSAAAIVLEAHPQSCPDADPRAVASECLQAAGFSLESAVPAHGSEWVIWAVRA